MHLPPFLTDVTIPALDHHRRTLEWCREMRAEHPVVYDEDHEMWMVFRYEDGQRVRRDHATFSSAQMIPAEHEFTSITNMDPPRHQRMRALISQAFSARTVAGLEPRVEAIVDELVGGALPDGRIDWVAEVANPLPLQVIAGMLGLPIERWRDYMAWTDTIVNDGPDRMDAAGRFVAEFADAIEAHRREPVEDVLGLLIAAEVDGERLDLANLLGFCVTLFVAGYITTNNLLGNAVLCLLEQPGTLARLRADPGLLAPAIEEILRFMPPFRASPNDIVQGRTATADVELAGARIRAGERVQVNRVSVNFDEGVFADPERFDIDRDPNPHQSFGHGIHYCIGAPLARLEARTALRALVERLDDVRLELDGPVQQLESRLMFGPRSLPLRFRPRPLPGRAGAAATPASRA